MASASARAQARQAVPCGSRAFFCKPGGAWAAGQGVYALRSGAEDGSSRAAVESPPLVHMDDSASFGEEIGGMDYAAVLRARIVGDEQPARYPEGIGSAYMAFYAFTSESRATTPGPVTNVQAAIAVSPATAHITDAPLAAAATRSSARIHQHAASLVETQLDSATTATATASAPRCERPSVIARKLNTGRKGRTPKSEAMRWKDPEVQKRLRELKQLWRNGVLAQPKVAAILRREFNKRGISHATVSRRFAELP